MFTLRACQLSCTYLRPSKACEPPFDVPTTVRATGATGSCGWCGLYRGSWARPHTNEPQSRARARALSGNVASLYISVLLPDRCGVWHCCKSVFLCVQLPDKCGVWQCYKSVFLCVQLPETCGVWQCYKSVFLCVQLPDRCGVWQCYKSVFLCVQLPDRCGVWQCCKSVFLCCYQTDAVSGNVASLYISVLLPDRCRVWHCCKSVFLYVVTRQMRCLAMLQVCISICCYQTDAVSGTVASLYFCMFSCQTSHQKDIQALH